MSSGGQRVVVVGAGGQAAARRLSDSGHGAIVFELGSRVGGLRVCEKDNGRSPVKASLRINSEARGAAFDDIAFREWVPRFPSQTVVAAYLHDFAVKYVSLELVRFETGLNPVVRGADARSWRPHLSDGSTSEFDLVVATGHQQTPAHPAFTVDFMGDYMHSRLPRLGTGCRQARSRCRSGQQRCGHRLQHPHRHHGHHAQRQVPNSDHAADALRKAVGPNPCQGRITTAVVAGGPSDSRAAEKDRFRHDGTKRLETPRTRTRTRTHPAGHPTVMRQIEWDRIPVQQGAHRVVDRTVHFTDGSNGTLDPFIAATGYDVALPFLPSGLCPVRGRGVFPYRRMVPTGLCGLYLGGFVTVSGGANIRITDVQARWLAGVVDGRVTLPDVTSMRAEIDKEKRHMTRRFSSSARYILEPELRPYERTLVADVDTATTDDAKTVSLAPSGFRPDSPA